jgi:hypothetical protein
MGLLAALRQRRAETSAEIDSGSRLLFERSEARLAWIEGELVRADRFDDIDKGHRHFVIGLLRRHGKEALECMSFRHCKEIESRITGGIEHRSLAHAELVEEERVRVECSLDLHVARNGGGEGHGADDIRCPLLHGESLGDLHIPRLPPDHDRW